MLQELIDSKDTAALLALFLAAPPRAFSIFELSRRLRLSHGQAAHGLNRLVKEGLVHSFTKRNKKYFLLNERTKLLPELKKFGRGHGYQDELLLAIKRLGEIKAAFLSGVFTGYPNLPVDVLLVGRANLRKLADFLKAVEKMMGQEINYSVMSENEFLLRRDTFDRFIKDIFDYRHIVVLDKLKG
ncbi:MAG: hypothetical protein KGJ93_03410 [Patescibacteria group bacterium]|nr:hypothetical protein [Patescibacteria group bacterium]